MKQSRVTPDVMPVAEIRWWLYELHGRGWKWLALGRALGLKWPGSLREKISGKERLWLGEHIRISKQLRRIIAGEIVAAGSGTPHHAQRAVQADTLKPVQTAPHWHIDVRRGTAALRGSEPPPPTLPSFRRLFEHPKEWRWK
jgi:hypothetical protein